MGLLSPAVQWRTGPGVPWFGPGIEPAAGDLSSVAGRNPAALAWSAVFVTSAFGPLMLAGGSLIHCWHLFKGGQFGKVSGE